MKVRSSVKPICEKCKIIKRKGSIRVICGDLREPQAQAASGLTDVLCKLKRLTVGHARRRGTV